MLNNSEIKSPITGNSNVSLIEKFDSKKIIEIYSKDLKVDVQKYFADADSIALYECKQTGYRFFTPYTVIGDGEFYSKLQHSTTSYYSQDKWEHKKALEFINPSDHLLEIGCGSGFFLQKVASKGAKVLGADFNEKAIEEAKKKGLQVENRSVEDMAQLYPEKFDIVCFFQVLEHINDINGFITSALKCLKKGGKLIIGVPNNNPYLYKYDKFHALNLPPHHVGLWNKKSLKSLSSIYNLNIIKISTEPLSNLKYQTIIILKHFHLNGLASFVEKLPSSWINKPGILLRPFFKGRNILAIYEKR